MNKIEQFVYTLFKQGEYTCYAKDAKGFRVSPISEYNPSIELFCINPLHPTQDLNPQKDWHRSDLPRRADHNITSFRNFMIEIDTMDIDRQVEMLYNIEMPITSLVYSGGKSIHAIISLTEALPNYDEYKIRSEALVNIVPMADKTSKNPSRLSRFPGSKRSDKKGQPEQELLYLSEQVTIDKLDKWLNDMGGLQKVMPKKKKNLRAQNLGKDFESVLKDCSSKTLQCVRDPYSVIAGEGERHHTLKSAVVDLYYSGADVDDIHRALEPLEIALGIDDRQDLERLIEWVEYYL